MHLLRSVRLKNLHHAARHLVNWACRKSQPGAQRASDVKGYQPVRDGVMNWSAWSLIRSLAVMEVCTLSGQMTLHARETGQHSRAE